MARRLFAYGKAVATPDGTRAILIESRGRADTETPPEPDPEKIRADFFNTYPHLRAGR